MNPPHVCRAAFIAAIVVCCTGATAAMAGDTADREGMTLRWACVQQHDESFNVRCTPRLEASSSRAFSVRWAALFWEDIVGQPPARHAVAVAANRGDFRPVAMRNSDEVFSGEAWYVALHSAPTDVRNVIRALQSALCGTVSHCRVTYSPGED